MDLEIIVYSFHKLILGDSQLVIVPWQQDRLSEPGEDNVMAMTMAMEWLPFFLLLCQRRVVDRLSTLRTLTTRFVLLRVGASKESLCACALEALEALTEPLMECSNSWFSTKARPGHKKTHLNQSCCKSIHTESQCCMIVLFVHR